MIWLTWRQHRLTVLALTAVFLGLALLHLLGYGKGVGVLDPRTVLPVLPALGGMFLGAPLLARELEQRSFCYTWTQGISKGRWLFAKLGLLGGLLLLLSVAFADAHRRWYKPKAQGDPGGWFGAFDQGMVTFPAYCLFAFMLGVAASAVTRRLLLSSAITLVGYLSVFLVVGQWWRPNYLSPLRGIWDEPTLGAVLDVAVVDRIGAEFDLIEGLQRAGATSDVIGLEQYRMVSDAGMQIVYYYQPADRFWTFQFIEGGIFVALAAGCVALTYWCLRTRLA